MDIDTLSKVFRFRQNTVAPEATSYVAAAVVIIVFTIITPGVSSGRRVVVNNFFKFKDPKKVEGRSKVGGFTFRIGYFNRVIKKLELVKGLALSKRYTFGVVPKDLMFPIFQFLGPIRFVEKCFIRKELSFISPIKNRIKLVKAFVLKKDFGFKGTVCPNLIFCVFDFIELVDFNTVQDDPFQYIPAIHD